MKNLNEVLAWSWKRNGKTEAPSPEDDVIKENITHENESPTDICFDDIINIIGLELNIW